MIPPGAKFALHPVVDSASLSTFLWCIVALTFVANILPYHVVDMVLSWVFVGQIYVGGGRCKCCNEFCCHCWLSITSWNNVNVGQSGPFATGCFICFLPVPLPQLRQIQLNTFPFYRRQSNCHACCHYMIAIAT